jgi:hypothetical protein
LRFSPTSPSPSSLRSTPLYSVRSVRFDFNLSRASFPH